MGHAMKTIILPCCILIYGLFRIITTARFVGRESASSITGIKNSLPNALIRAFGGVIESHFRLYTAMGLTLSMACNNPRTIGSDWPGKFLTKDSSDRASTTLTVHPQDFKDSAIDCAKACTSRSCSSKSITASPVGFPLKESLNFGPTILKIRDCCAFCKSASSFACVRLLDRSRSISRFEAMNEIPNAKSSIANPPTTILQKNLLYLSLAWWRSDQPSPQQPTPITMMLKNSTHSQNESQDGDEVGGNTDAIIRFNYFSAVCAFITAAMLTILGIFGKRK